MEKTENLTTIFNDILTDIRKNINVELNDDDVSNFLTGDFSFFDDIYDPIAKQFKKKLKEFRKQLPKTIKTYKNFNGQYYII